MRYAVTVTDVFGEPIEGPTENGYRTFSPPDVFTVTARGADGQVITWLDSHPPRPGYMLAVSIGADEMLTPAELRAMDLTVELVNVMCQEVIGRGRTREHDVAEFVAQIHQVQASILSQAAGRAYPDRFRLLGETLAGLVELGESRNAPARAI